MKLQLALTLIWTSTVRGEERRGEEKERGDERRGPQCPDSGNPFVTRAAVAMEICSAMMNQPCQGKHLPDNIYFMIFHSRGNNKDRKNDKEMEIVRKINSQEMETVGRDQTVSCPVINQSKYQATLQGNKGWQLAKN